MLLALQKKAAIRQPFNFINGGLKITNLKSKQTSMVLQ